MVDAYMGDLVLNLNNLDRLLVLNMASIYLETFINAMAHLEILEKQDLEWKDCKIVNRNDKIRRYKEELALNEKLEYLKCIQKDVQDDELTRETSLLLLKLWIKKSIEHVKMIAQEKEMLAIQATEVS